MMCPEFENFDNITFMNGINIDFEMFLAEIFCNSSNKTIELVHELYI